MQCGDLRKVFKREDFVLHKDTSARVASRLPSFSKNVDESDDEYRDDAAHTYAGSADHTISR